MSSGGNANCTLVARQKGFKVLTLPDDLLSTMFINLTQLCVVALKTLIAQTWRLHKTDRV